LVAAIALKRAGIWASRLRLRAPCRASRLRLGAEEAGAVASAADDEEEEDEV
jgi:hypothetical protein